MKDNEKQYTRKQIVETIKYWKKLLETMSATEANTKGNGDFKEFRIYPFTYSSRRYQS